MERTWSSSETKDILSIGLSIDGVETLHKIDISKPVEDIISNICNEHKLLYVQGERGLWTDTFIDGTAYVSDDNKYKILPGSMLYLQESPMNAAHVMIDKLLKSDVKDFETFSRGYKDLVILKSLHTANAQDVMYSILVSTKQAEIFCYGLQFISALYSHKFIRRVPSNVVTKIFEFVAGWHKFSKDLILECLNFLAEIRRYGRLRYPKDIFSILRHCIQNSKDSDLQTASLKLFNYLVMFPNDREEEEVAMKCVVNENVARCIYSEILRGPVPKVLQQQLYRYQSLTLREYWQKKVKKVKSTDPIMRTIQDINKRVRKGDFIRRRVVSESEDNFYDSSTTKNSLSGVMDNIMASFRWPKKVPKPLSLQKDTPDHDTDKAISSPKTSDKLKRLPTLKDIRKGAKFYSCIHIGKEDKHEKKQPPLHFEFYGPIQYLETSDEQESKETHILHRPVTVKRSLSVSAIDTPSGSVTELIKNEKGVGESSTSTFTISQLTVDNLKYLAKHHPRLYHKWCLTKRRRHEFADQITQMLCRLVEVGRSRPVDEPADSYHPLLFGTYPYFIEVLFCEALQLHDKTGKEMKARVDSDIPKVLAIMKRQLSSALNAKPLDLNSLWEHLNATPYEVIELKIQAELKERIQHDLSHKPVFLEFRESCKKEVENLIKKKRIDFMLQGQHLPKVTAKGDIHKSVTQYLLLESDKATFRTRDCSRQRCFDCSMEPDMKLFNVSDIIEVTYGKKSQFYHNLAPSLNEQDPFFRHTRGNQYEMPHWTRLLSLKMVDGSYYDFCAPDEPSLHHWVDGINILIGKPMSSPGAEADAIMLLDMEVRLKFLDLEGIPIPDLPPALPPPPNNYNFHARRKNRVK